MLLRAKSLAPWLVVLAVVLAVGVLAAPPTQKKRATVIDRTGPPQAVAPTRRRFDEPHAERHCVHQGGVCRYVRDCPKGKLTSVKGLCPKQQKSGVECCYARPSYTKYNRKGRNSRYSRHQRRDNNRNNKYWQ